MKLSVTSCYSIIQNGISAIISISGCLAAVNGGSALDRLGPKHGPKHRDTVCSDSVTIGNFNVIYVALY